MSTSALDLLGGLSPLGFFGLSTGSGTDAQTATTGSFGPSSLLSLSSPTTSILQAAYQPATATTPTDPRTLLAEQELLKDAALQIAGGDSAAAKKLLEDYIAKNRAGGDVVATLASLEQGAGDYDKAAQLYRRAATLRTDRGYDADEANARLLRLDDRKVLAAARQKLAQAETRESGVKLLRALTGRSPALTEARLLLGETLAADGQRIEGLAEFGGAIASADEQQLQAIDAKLKKLEKRTPDDAFLKLLQGRLRLRQGASQEALDTLQKAYELSQGSAIYAIDLAEALTVVGREKLQDGRISEALTDLHKAKVYDPANTTLKRALSDAYTARAEQKARRNALGDAIGDFRVALLELGGVDVERRKKIANLLFATGSQLESQNIAAGKDIGAEAGAFQEAFNVDPDNLRFRERLATVRNRAGDQFLAAGKYKDAASSYRAAYELYRNNSTYKSNTINALRLHGDSRVAAYAHDEAIKAYNDAYQLDTSDATSKTKLAQGYNTRGVYYRALGDVGRAAADFRSALELFPDDAVFLENLASVEG